MTVDRDKGELEDPRPQGQRKIDARAARSQSGALSASCKGDAFDRDIARRVLRRRAAGSDDDPVFVECEDFDTRRPNGTVLLVRGELLVRDDLPQHLVEGVSRLLHGARPEPVAGVKGLSRFVRQGGGGDDVDDLVAIAAQVRRMGHQASVSHVTPLRVVVKGLGGPEVTAVTEGYVGKEPVEGGPVVAVVDSGVTEEAREDRWLLDVVAQEGKASIDPLDVYPLGSTHVVGGKRVPGNGRLDFAAGHGTFVAGVVRQVCPEAQVLMYRALDSDGVGSEVTVAQKMVQAAEDGARVINLSLGVQTVDDQPLLAIEVALEVLAEEYEGAVVVVAAAGNYGDRRPCFPAAQNGVVSVAALSAGMRPARWTSRGYWVDCSAVGEGVVSTFVVGQEEQHLDPSGPDTWEAPDPWAVWSGTSFAAPQVAGAIARRMRDGSPDAPTALREVLATGRPAPDVGRTLRIMPGTAW